MRCILVVKNRFRLAIFSYIVQSRTDAPIDLSDVRVDRGSSRMYLLEVYIALTSASRRNPYYSDDFHGSDKERTNASAVSSAATASSTLLTALTVS